MNEIRGGHYQVQHGCRSGGMTWFLPLEQSQEGVGLPCCQLLLCAKGLFVYFTSCSSFEEGPLYQG